MPTAGQSMITGCFSITDMFLGEISPSLKVGGTAKIR